MTLTELVQHAKDHGCDPDKTDVAVLLSATEHMDVEIRHVDFAARLGAGGDVLMIEGWRG